MKKIENWKKVLEGDLEYVAQEVRNIAQAPAVIILTGPVGAGKTTFTKKFIAMTNKDGKEDNKSVQDQVQSPTYSIVQESGNVVHADLYRLEDKEELIHLELPLHVDNKEFLLVEWGRPYLRELQRQIGQDFKFYELEIEVNEGPTSSGAKAPSRNISLAQID